MIPTTVATKEEEVDASPYHLKVDPAQDDRATEINIFSFARPHMRGFHASWIGFFMAFISWFSIAPLMPYIQPSLKMTASQVWISNTVSVSGTIGMRFILGPLCSMYGPKKLMAATLIIGSIPVFLTGTVTTFEGLCVLRFFIGLIGATFVMCQFWTYQMFAKNVVGTANAIAGGWGNLGGGVTNLLMGSALMPLFIIFCNGDNEKAWRSVFVVPALLTLLTGIGIYIFSKDTPHGDFSELKAKGELPETNPGLSLLTAMKDRNVIILMFQYACCFGVELVMDNAAASYFNTTFKLSKSDAAAAASTFGFMNFCCRALGGMLSDKMNQYFSLRGRLIVQFFTLLFQGIMIVIFSQQTEYSKALGVMIIFSAFCEAACGTTYGIVPFINPEFTGSISGAVGAGGNVGALCFSILFLYGQGTAWSINVMGYIVLCSTILTFFISIPGYAMLVGGKENETLKMSNSRATFSSQVDLMKKGQANGSSGSFSKVQLVEDIEKQNDTANTIVVKVSAGDDKVTL